MGIGDSTFKGDVIKIIDDHDILLKIDECEILSANTFFIYRPTWNLIISALKWSIGKNEYEIKKRIEVCEMKIDPSRFNMLGNNWRLIIQTLRWVLEETELDPIEARKDLIPFA